MGELQNDLTQAIESNQVVSNLNENGDKLGDLFWYSIGSQLIQKDLLESYFNQTGVEKEFMPNPIRMVDAFKRATVEIAKKNVPTDQPKVFRNYIIREIYTDKDAIQRNIVIETVDQEGKKLAYDSQAAILKLDKKNKSFEIVQSNDTLAQGLAHEADDRFRKYVSHYAAQNLRQMTAKALAACAPTMVRPNGGVYFIPRTFDEKMNRLRNLINLLEQSHAWAIPVVNSEDNKQMVNVSLREKMMDAALNAENIIRTPNVRREAIVRALNEAKQCVHNYNIYKAVVEMDTDDFDKRVADLNELAAELMDKDAAQKAEQAKK